MKLGDKELLSFIHQNHFSPNALWAPDNPVIHCWLANEFFDYIQILIEMIPERINPNLCDGERYGRKSVLILLSLLPPAGSLASEFIERYKSKLKFDYQDKNGKTALHYAVILGRHELVEQLISCRASITIQDKEGKTPFDYLNCKAGLIAHTLKSVDIEPSRDTKALKNSVVDNENHTIIINGEVLVQNKQTIDALLARKNAGFTRYRVENPGCWGPCIGDDTQATSEYALSIAESIARDYDKPLDLIFMPEKLSADYSQQFRENLTGLSTNFSGRSVLEECVNGHAIIERNLARYNVSNGPGK